jgi:hypothetical protein
MDQREEVKAGRTSSEHFLDMDLPQLMISDYAPTSRTDAHLSDSEREMLFTVLDDGAPPQHAAKSMAGPRSIPVPNATFSSQHHQPQSQASSQGSSGSAFFNSMLNPNAHQLSHTPPTGLGASYEASHFGKRARSGSVSGRLRTASEYLENKGLLDRQTKGILKDLIIIGDEELQRALDRYEMDGDPSLLEEMISSGALEQRLPPDLDILGDFTLDFLTMNDDDDDDEHGIDYGANIDHHQQQQQQQQQQHPDQTASRSGKQLGQPSMVSPAYDDGIGDLEFAGDFVSQSNNEQDDDFAEINAELNLPSVENSLDNEDAMMMSEHERRMRSNSLFSALLNDTPRQAAEQQAQQPFGDWRDQMQPAAVKSTEGITIGSSSSAHNPNPSTGSGIAASLDDDDQRKKKEKKKRKEKTSKKKKEEEDEAVEYIPGSGRPRALSDPNLRTSHDMFGLIQVDRPDGWVGAYSPESRKVRIDRFLEKRTKRVWSKTIKYDVRKNFADSRLRVKGRFVRKEDELLMRELMSLT